ncbi:type II secretion system F family protein [Terrimesophilobacter mesophilus]|uniref:Pilus assembly protein n=1 Tax=Terrimesophilobacter mesophilus TaxID=433647 RepID=A0A4R8VDC8_9MICO|nr:type II secretion system F family protein [Terrimesophilobacter mesophilus]TFB80883.1 pilus assembly protein [Terrimesophilobacter mesophilus]
MTVLALSIVCGLGLGLGLWTLASLAPRLSRPKLVHRVAPYLVDVSEGARTFLRRRDSNPIPVFGTLLGPLLGRLRGMVTAVLGGSALLERRLRQSGSSLTVDAFRSQQLVWAIVGTVLGIVASLVFSRTSALPILGQVLLVVVGAAAGFLGREQHLQRSARKRLSRMSAELPVVLEFLTLSLSAGEGVLDSFRRISAVSTGELAGEIGGVVAAANSGSALADSLHRLGDDIRMPALTRCIDQIVGALERGTPLTGVLRAQAQDAREQSKRDLLELAGKKEVAMMIPLVFLILPVTILFAVFPGIFVLQVGF